MGKGKKSTSFLGDMGWYAVTAMIVAVILTVAWVLSIVARLIYPNLDAQSNIAQMVVLWEVIDNIFVLMPIMFGLLLAVTGIVVILEVKTLKVVSAVTQNNQTVIVSPDGNPLHSVQISTGTHVRLPEQNPGAPPSTTSEQLTAETPASVESDQEQGGKHKISRPCRAWHVFWRKIRKNTDYDEDDSTWIDNERLFDGFVGRQKAQDVIKEIDQQIIDLDAEAEAEETDVEREGSLQTTARQTVDVEAEAIERQVAEAEKKIKEQDAPSGNTENITRAIDAAINKQESLLDGVNKIIEECNVSVAESVTNIVRSTENDTDFFDDGEDETTAGVSLTTQARMARQLEEDGFYGHMMVDGESQVTSKEHPEDQVTATAQAEVVQSETIVPKDGVTSLAAKIEFDPETAQVLEMLMRIVKFMKGKGISSVADFTTYLATANVQQTSQQEEEKVDEATLDKLCLQYQVELSTTDDALVVDYPDQDGVTLVVAVQIDDSVQKHRAIAHNLGLFPEELNYALGYMHSKIVDIKTPSDIQSIWNIASIAIAASGLRDGYDPSACVRPKEINVAKFLDGQGAEPNEAVQPEADPAKVFPFPSYQEEESSSGEPLASGTGRLPYISRALGRQQHR